MGEGCVKPSGRETCARGIGKENRFFRGEKKVTAIRGGGVLLGWNWVSRNETFPIEHEKGDKVGLRIGASDKECLIVGIVWVL